MVIVDILEIGKYRDLKVGNFPVFAFDFEEDGNSLKQQISKKINNIPLEYLNLSIEGKDV